MHTWSAVEAAAPEQAFSENTLEIFLNIERDKPLH